MVKCSSKRKSQRLSQSSVQSRYDQFSWPEATFCPTCGALYLNGRWTWQKRDSHQHQSQCPACQRTQENQPAGQIELRGKFLKVHHHEIINLILTTEETEKAAHPLERIMSISDQDDTVVIRTTGIHMACRIGKALSRSYKGDYDFQYGDHEQFILVSWKREL
ncbi:BCAM0308 family protein [Chloroherpeton thalassium]|nr:BCAM0308 family protein [Chloroherpeton thalassium]